jgi:cytochrome c556
VSSQLARCSLALILVSFASIAGAEGPAAPKMSTLVAADHLAAAVDGYVKALEGWLKDEATFTANLDAAGRAANNIVAVSLILGNHDQDNRYKATASAVMPAARDLTRAKDYGTAKAAWDRVQAALKSPSPAAAAPAWERAASLGRLMKEVVDINNRLKRNAKRLDRTKDENLESAAVLTALAQAAIYDTHEVKNPADFDKWYTMMTAMRDTAVQLTTDYQAGNADAVAKSLTQLETSCKTCHAVFHKKEDK